MCPYRDRSTFDLYISYCSGHGPFSHLFESVAERIVKDVRTLDRIFLAVVGWLHGCSFETDYVWEGCIAAQVMCGEVAL